MSMAEMIAQERIKRGLAEPVPSTVREGSVPCEPKELEKKRKANIKKKKKKALSSHSAAHSREEETGEEESDGFDTEGALMATTSPHLLNISPQLVKYTDTRLGQGESCAMLRSNVLVEYRGFLASGHCFDASKRGSPLQFTIGDDAVVEGFEDGVLGMKLSGERTIHVPPEFGYGRDGFAACKIPPNASLRFEVRLLGVL